MKVRIEIEAGLQEDEVIIRTGMLSDAIVELQNYISKQQNGKRCIALENSNQKAMVSRNYYKLLMERLNAKKLGY